MFKKLKNNNFIKNILIYSFIFFLISLFILFLSFDYHKTFIRGADALYQHIVSLTHFRSMLINFIKTGHISTFTFNIGYGFDLFSNFAFYIFGDIVSYFSILFSKDSIPTIFGINIFIRIFLSGFTFLCYCNYKKLLKKSDYLSVIGPLMYSFCAYSLWAGFSHPFFIDALIIFPLVIIGIEKIILENKFVFYTIIVSLMFFTNFYFAYMMCLFIAIYGTILAVYNYKNEGIKKILLVLLKTILFSLLGIMISAIVLLPTAVSFLNSERISSNVIYPYSLSYYRNIFNSILSVSANSYWTFLGTQSIIFITLPIFIRRRKENYSLFITFLLFLLPLFFSQIASVLCCFGFPSNRWTFVYSFIFSLVTVYFFNSYNKIDKKDIIYIGGFILLYFIYNYFFDINLSSYAIFQIILLICMILLIIYKNVINKIKKINLYSLSFIIIFVISILSTVQYSLGSDNDGIFNYMLDDGEYSETLNTSRGSIPDFNNALKYIGKTDKGFYKISKYPYAFENLSLLKEYQSIGSYYSITPCDQSYLNLDLNNIQYAINRGSKEFDYRTKITSLLGVKYYITAGNNTIPYGYSLLDNYKGKSKVYRNDYALPFGVLYTDYIDIEQYNSLNPLEKENSLLKATAISSDSIKSNLTPSDINKNNSEINKVDYEIIDKNKILNDNKIVISSDKKNSISLKIKDVKNSELYLYIKGINFETLSKEEIISKNINKDFSPIEQQKIYTQYKWYQPNYSYNIKVGYNQISKTVSIEDYLTSVYYIDRNDFLFNLGYYEDTSDEITISFSKVGNYQFDTIEVYAVSMENYSSDINRLARSNFKVTDYGDGYLYGTIDSESAGVLQFSTIYSNGWKVYIDGNLSNTFASNKYFLGIEVPSGNHEIYMEYTNPFVFPGFIVSIIGILILILILIIILSKKKKKKRL